jgi:hypothetical protein
MRNRVRGVRAMLLSRTSLPAIAIALALVADSGRRWMTP